MLMYGVGALSTQEMCLRLMCGGLRQIPIPLHSMERQYKPLERQFVSAVMYASQGRAVLLLSAVCAIMVTAKIQSASICCTTHITHAFEVLQQLVLGVLTVDNKSTGHCRT